MHVCAQLLLLAALPALAGRVGWGAGGEVVSVTENGAGASAGSGGGGGPAFAPRQRTAEVLAAGQAATLECRVLRLADKSVSWVRSSDLQILSHAGSVFTADARVSAKAARVGGAGAAASRHALRIERLRPADGGRYECQVNTEPKMSLFFNLTVLDEPVPVVVVTAVGARRVHAAAGETATLACEARYEPPPRALPLPPLDLRWHKGERLISLQSTRGGVSLDTERWVARAVSRLTLAELAAEDAGAYTCSAAGAAATLDLHLTDPHEAEQIEAMQRDQSAAGGGAPAAARPASALVPLLVPLLMQLLAAAAPLLYPD